MVGLNPVDTHLEEVLSIAAGEVWVSSHMQTEGTLEIFNKLSTNSHSQSPVLEPAILFAAHKMADTF